MIHGRVSSGSKDKYTYLHFKERLKKGIINSILLVIYLLRHIGCNIMFQNRCTFLQSLAITNIIRMRKLSKLRMSIQLSVRREWQNCLFYLQRWVFILPGNIHSWLYIWEPEVGSMDFLQKNVMSCHLAQERFDCMNNTELLGELNTRNDVFVIT